MIVDCLVNEPRVVNQSIELCKWHVLHPEVYEIMRVYMRDLCLRDDVYDVMLWQMACGSADCIRGKEDDTTFRNAAQLVGF